MKFKKLMFPIAAFIMVLAMASCSDESENIIPQPDNDVVLNAGIGGDGEMAERD